MHLLVGWQWIVIGVIAILATFCQTKGGRLVVAVCAVAVLVEAAITLSLMGPFLGTHLMIAAAILIAAGGLTFKIQ